MAVNLSPAILKHNFFLSNIKELLNKYQVPAQFICFEVTENALMNEMERCIQTLNSLKQLGSRVSIDDFGTGYSSLSYLSKLPVDNLKIDRSFVTDMIKSPQNQKIVEMTVNLAHTLGLKVVAEGIEDQETMLQLQALGCDVAQGYHIGRPMPEEAFLNWLEKQSGTKVRSITRAVK